jgi:uncharacterized protein YgbK (DUF1537 family)
MLLGGIGDDFTGASDLANTLAKDGMATLQFIGAPIGDALRDCDRWRRRFVRSTTDRARWQFSPNRYVRGRDLQWLLNFTVS